MENVSQNLIFEGMINPDEEYPHPEGASLARVFKSALNKKGWVTSEIENWRDCGWEVTCERNGSKAFIAFSKMGTAGWFLQIAPTYVPGFIGGLFKKPISASPDDVHQLSVAVDDIVKGMQGLDEFYWLWDGPPEKGKSDKSPARPKKGNGAGR